VEALTDEHALRRGGCGRRDRRRRWLSDPASTERAGDGRDVDTSPTSTPAPTPVSTPQPLGDAQLEAGIVEAFTGPNGSIKLTFAVPDGWRGFGGSCVIPVTGTTAPDGMGICFGQVTAGLYSDPCHGSDGPADIPIGPTVDDLATALSQQTEYDSTTPTDVTLGGFSGKRMDLLLPSDVASCDLGSFTPWEGSIYAQGPDNRWHLWILDVEGTRVVVQTMDYPSTPADRRAELQTMLDSLEITP